jgi:hypothetical protein
MVGNAFTDIVINRDFEEILEKSINYVLAVHGRDGGIEGGKSTC